MFPAAGQNQLFSKQITEKSQLPAEVALGNYKFPGRRISKCYQDSLQLSTQALGYASSLFGWYQGANSDFFLFTARLRSQETGRS